MENIGGEKRSDPDEFFRRFPGSFLFFPVVTSGGGSGLQTIRSKIFTTTPVDSAATGVADRGALSPSPQREKERERGGGGGGRNRRGMVGKVAELQTRGMAAAWSRKPINLYACLSTYDLQSPPSPSHFLPLSTCVVECCRRYMSLSLSLSSLRHLSVTYRYFYLRLITPSCVFSQILLLKTLCVERKMKANS